MTLFFILTILLYSLITYSIINKKNKNIFNQKSNLLFSTKSKNNFLYNKIEQKKRLLENLGFPYKITIKKYLLTKYVLSILIFIISLINYKNLKIPTTLFLICFFLNDYLIYSFKKKENILLISEIKNLIYSLMLILSAHVPLKDAFSISITALKTSRFKTEYERFIYNYKNGGYLLKDALKKLEINFNSYELSLFINTVSDLEKQGNILDGLEKLLASIDLSYFKYLKRKQEQRLLYLTLGTVLILINITLIIMYPIAVEAINNLGVIFG